MANKVDSERLPVFVMAIIVVVALWIASFGPALATYPTITGFMRVSSWTAAVAMAAYAFFGGRVPRKYGGRLLSAGILVITAIGLYSVLPR